MGVARVVGGEVAQDPPAPLVDGGAEPGVRLAAAEQLVDLGEGGRVVAVVALAGEDRRRVEHVGADRGDVVEVLGDAVQVAAVELHGRARVAALEDDLVVPLRRQRPVRDLPLVGRGRAGEAVGEDLVDDAVATPVGCGRVGGQPEVDGVGQVVAHQPGAGQPLLLALPVGEGAHEEEAVVRDRVVHRQVALPPHHVAGGGRRRRVEDRLGVVRRPQPDRLDRVCRARADAHGDGGAELGCLVGDVERGPVVVGVVEEAHGPHPPSPRMAAAPSGARRVSSGVEHQSCKLGCESSNLSRGSAVGGDA